MSNNPRFQTGHGVFNCFICHRQTRGNDESAQLELCGQCYELSGWDNHHNDADCTPDAETQAKYDALLKTIGERGGDVKRVRAVNSYIFKGEQS